MYFNLPEADSAESNNSAWYTENPKKCDTKAFVEVSCESLDVDISPPNTVKDVLRLGPKRNESDKPRPLRVTFSDITTKRQVLQNSKLLKRGKHHYIYVNPDLTPQQRQKAYEVRQELKRRKASGDGGLYILKKDVL